MRSSDLSKITQILLRSLPYSRVLFEFWFVLCFVYESNTFTDVERCVFLDVSFFNARQSGSFDFPTFLISFTIVSLSCRAKFMRKLLINSAVDFMMNWARPLRETIVKLMKNIKIFVFTPDFSIGHFILYTVFYASLNHYEASQKHWLELQLKQNIQVLPAYNEKEYQTNQRVW